MADNLCYAQSGGVTAVINATAAAVINAARRQPKIGKVFAAQNGVLGLLNEELIDAGKTPPSVVAAWRHTPGGVFGSCRLKLPPPADAPAVYERLMAVFQAHNIRHFLYNGGNDSADTTLKIARAAKTRRWRLNAIGIPKTIDNDLAATDCSPGFGSAAKYVAISVMEATLDIAAMARTSTKVFILEVMGRHSGWLAAAAGLAGQADGVHIILFPEVPFRQKQFFAAVTARVEKHGYAVVVVSEGARDGKGDFLAADKTTDHFAHRQLGGAAPLIAAMIRQKLNYKCHWGVADYLQRSARHIASKTDVTQATRLGEAAVRFAAAGQSAVMPVIRRGGDSPYRWKIVAAKLGRIANKEKKLPPSFISRDGFFISEKCRRYLTPLIRGEEYPPYQNGLPRYWRGDHKLIGKKLPPYRG